MLIPDTNAPKAVPVTVPADAVEDRRQHTRRRLLTYVAVLVCTLGLLYLAALAVKVALDGNFLGAADSQKYVVAYIATGALILGACTTLNERYCWWFVAVIAAICLTAIVTLFGLSGNIGAAGLAVATLLLSFSIGVWAWYLLLGSIAPWLSALTIGAGILALLVFLAGIAGAIRSWTLTWPLMGVLAVVLVLAAKGHGPLTLRTTGIRGPLGEVDGFPRWCRRISCTPLHLGRVGSPLGISTGNSVRRTNAESLAPSLVGSDRSTSLPQHMSMSLWGARPGSAQLLAVLGHLLG